VNASDPEGLAPNWFKQVLVRFVQLISQEPGDPPHQVYGPPKPPVVRQVELPKPPIVIEGKFKPNPKPRGNVPRMRGGGLRVGGGIITLYFLLRDVIFPPEVYYDEHGEWKRQPDGTYLLIPYG
jgi:hypothetical protein